MSKLKNILFLVLLVSYLAVLSGFIGNRETSSRISTMQINIKDSVDYQFLRSKDVSNMLNNNNMQIIGQMTEEIRLEDIENFLNRNQIIRQAEVYITEPGVLHLDVRQKDPFIRIINQSGQGYYLDRNGNIIPVSDEFSPYVLVASGSIREPFRIRETTNIFDTEHGSLPGSQQVLYELFELAAYIDSDDFWKAQIEQIFVNKNYDFELVPRVGPHIIEFGKAENIEEKFENLQLLYNQGLNNLGWNQYIKINVKYKNQVVCTKIQ